MNKHVCKLLELISAGWKSFYYGFFFFSPSVYKWEIFTDKTASLFLEAQTWANVKKLRHLNFMKWSVKHAQIFWLVAFNTVSNIKHSYFHFNPLFTKYIIIKCHWFSFSCWSLILVNRLLVRKMFLVILRAIIVIITFPSNFWMFQNFFKISYVYIDVLLYGTQSIKKMEYQLPSLWK